MESVPTLKRGSLVATPTIRDEREPVVVCEGVIHAGQSTRRVVVWCPLHVHEDLAVARVRGLIAGERPLSSKRLPKYVWCDYFMSVLRMGCCTLDRWRVQGRHGFTPGLDLFSPRKGRLMNERGDGRTGYADEGWIVSCPKYPSIRSKMGIGVNGELSIMLSSPLSHDEL
jgi:hypothetical protein